MRTIALFLVLCPLIATAQEVRDTSTGLVVNIPDGWDRDTLREKGAVKFSGLYDIAKGKYIRFTAEAVPAENFTADSWLKNEQEAKKKYLKETAQPFTKDSGRVIGGYTAVGYSVGGTAVNGQAVRFRVYGVVHGEFFFQITEMSVNDAHKDNDEVIKSIWEAVKFEEGGMGEGGGMPSGDGKAQEISDTKGNYKLTILPGWEVTREPPEDDTQLRYIVARNDSNENPLIILEVWRIMHSNPAVFTTSTPTDMIENFLNRDNKFFESYYGEGTHATILPEIDESAGLGTAAKGGMYEVRGITADEENKRAEAEKLIRRGDKSVKMPEFKPIVIRGRIAMISPYIYVVRAQFRRSQADNDDLIAEYNKVLDSWQFLSTEARQPPLRMGDKVIGNTRADPAAQTERKESIVYEQRGVKTHRIQFDLVLPKGFLWIPKAGERVSLIYAQDDQNNWIQMQLSASSHNAVGEQNKKFENISRNFDTWRSNWESKARGYKFPRKPQAVKLGAIKGKGYKLLTGRIENFPGTFTGVASDKKGWRMALTVETRGDALKVFEKELKLFYKKLKFKPLKK